MEAIMAKSTQDMLQEATDAFAQKLTAIVEASVSEALAKATADLKIAPPSTRGKRGQGKGSAAPATRRKKGAKRSPAELEKLKADLLAQIRKTPEQGIEALSKAMGVSTRELKGPMMKLINEKAVKTKGHKRATKYTAR